MYISKDIDIYQYTKSTGYVLILALASAYVQRRIYLDSVHGLIHSICICLIVFVTMLRNTTLKERITCH